MRVLCLFSEMWPSQGREQLAQLVSGLGFLPKPAYHVNNREKKNDVIIFTDCRTEIRIAMLTTGCVI